MDLKYLEVEHEVIRRRRWLNTLYGLRLGAMLAVMVSLIHLAAVYAGILEMAQTWWVLPIVSVLAIWGGVRWGKSRPLRVQEDLYRVDRAFGLGEKLSTIYELRRTSGGTDFLMALYRSLKGVQIEPARALSMSPSERRSWLHLGGLGLAALALLGLYFAGVPKLPLGDLLSGLVSKNATVELKPPSMPNFEQPPLVTKPDDKRSESEAGVGSTPSPSGRPGSPSPDGQARLAEDQTSNDPNANPAGGPGEPTLNAPPQAELQRLEEAIMELRERLEHGELSPEELREQLEQLVEQASSFPEAKEVLERAADTLNSEELEHQLQEALSRLAGQEPKEGPNEASAAGEASQDSASPSGNEPTASKSEGDQKTSNGQGNESDKSQTGQASGRDKEGNEEASQGQKGSSSGSEQGEEASGSEQSEQSASGSPSENPSGRGELEKSKSGQQNPSDEPGGGIGQEPSQHSQAPSGRLLPTLRDLLIRGGQLPRDAKLLESFLTKGIPVDLAGKQPDGMPILKVNLERVESLLELRDLDPELRGLVRAYFLAITSDD